MAKPVVLVVEDEPDIQETFGAVLTIEGFTTVTARHIDEALECFGRQDIDAVTLDVRMPDLKGLGRDGLTLLKHLRSIPGFRAVPVFMFTGADLTPAEEELIANHNAKIFRKPMLYGDIVEALNRKLSHLLRSH